MSEAAIEIQGLSKRYRIGKKKYETLRYSLSNMFKRNKGKDFWALDNIDLTIDKGETVGVIGKNGAGKSTLLKILSKITFPTRGQAILTGKVASLLEVGTGFHPELTGRENIFLNGSLLGMTHKEISGKLEKIVEFVGIGTFLDTPVKHYSSGMYVRLAFSVASYLDSDILLVDEVLAVGDHEFQQKCVKSLNDSMGKKTVIFVSHDLDLISKLCERTVWLENGKIKAFSNTEEVINAYKNPKRVEEKDDSRILGSRKADVSLVNNTVALSHQSFNLEFLIQNVTEKRLEKLRLDVAIDDASGSRLGWLTNENNRLGLAPGASQKVKFVIRDWIYKTGKYSITTYLENDDGVVEYDTNKAVIYTQSAREELYKTPPDGQGNIFLNYQIQ